MNRFLIIDAAVERGVQGTLDRLAEPLTYRSLFAGTPEASHSAIGPWLVLDSGSEHLHHWVRTIERTSPSALTFLTSSQPFERVYAHLRQLLNLELSDGTIALLRYYDPRVMSLLQRILSEEQVDTLMGPFEEWRTTQGRYTR